MFLPFRCLSNTRQTKQSHRRIKELNKLKKKQLWTGDTAALNSKVHSNPVSFLQQSTEPVAQAEFCNEAVRGISLPPPRPVFSLSFNHFQARLSLSIKSRSMRAVQFGQAQHFTARTGRAQGLQHRTLGAAQEYTRTLTQAKITCSAFLAWDATIQIRNLPE